MKRTRSLSGVVGLVLACVAVVTFWAGEASCAGAAGWKAGLARETITPQRALWMAGYSSRTRPAEGTLHDLWLKVLALEDASGGRAIVVTADLLGFPRRMYDEICEGAKARFGLERAALMLSGSHTHSGPVLAGSLSDIYPLDDAQREAIAEYSARLTGRVLDAIGRALGDLRPATLATARGRCGFAVNRRENTEIDLTLARAAGRAPCGPSDHDVPILVVGDEGARVRALVFGYACHNTTLSDYEWCGDYAGYAQLELESRLGGGVQAMYAAGCGADQNPLPRRSVELCRVYGRALAEAVERGLGGARVSVGPGLRVGHEFVDLRFDPVATRADLEAAIARGGYQASWGRRLLGELERGAEFPASYRYPVQVWRLGEGDLLWIVLGGEVVVDYALRFKGLYGERAWVTAYANDLMAYIPSRRVRDEGRYEAGAFAVYGLPAMAWASDIEERIADAVGRLTR